MTPFLRLRLTNKGLGEFRADASTIWLYDVIATDDEEAEWWGGVSPRQFIGALAALNGRDVTIRVNSPGGSTFGAQAMVAAMRQHSGAITVRVDSLAASAASVIAAEAAVCEVVPGAMLMIHKAWTLAVGNADDLTATAGLLRTIDEQIAATYQRRAGRDVSDWLTAMEAETWYSAEEAVAAGLADRLIEDNTQRAHRAQWDLSAYRAAPAAAMPGPSDDTVPAPVLAGLNDTQRRQMLLRIKGI